MRFEVRQIGTFRWVVRDNHSVYVVASTGSREWARVAADAMNNGLDFEEATALANAEVFQTRLMVKDVG